ncbi:NUDIX domain-containing protein [bacterium]|jgi:8-oxo-dGTP diphosphatase|nr:NUDIX domain-containing protein [bacterium]MBT6293311.1 NUDIX domain-containing protein [bacterium]
MAQKFKVYFAVYLVLKRDGKILMAKRSNTGYMDGMYSLVAGHVDGNETVYQAMLRETKEEVNIDIIAEDMKVVHVSHRNSKDTKREYIDVYLKASKFKGELLNLEPDKCSELKWFNSHEYPENIVPEVKSVLENLSKGNFFSTLGF